MPAVAQAGRDGPGPHAPARRGQDLIDDEVPVAGNRRRERAGAGIDCQPEQTALPAAAHRDARQHAGRAAVADDTAAQGAVAQPAAGERRECRDDVARGRAGAAGHG